MATMVHLPTNGFSPCAAAAEALAFAALEDSLAALAEALSLAALADSLAALVDSLAVLADSLALEADALAEALELEAELAEPLLLLLQAAMPMTDNANSAAVAIANSFFFRDLPFYRLPSH